MKSGCGPCFIVCIGICLIIGIPCFIYGCDKDINSECKYYDVEDAFCYGYGTSSTICGCGTDCITSCFKSEIYVIFNEFFNCSVFLGNYKTESDAIYNAEGYYHETFHVLRKKDDGTCTIDLDLAALLYAGLVFLALSALIISCWFYGCVKENKEDYFKNKNNKTTRLSEFQNTLLESQG